MPKVIVLEHILLPMRDLNIIQTLLGFEGPTSDKSIHAKINIKTKITMIPILDLNT